MEGESKLYDSMTAVLCAKVLIVSRGTQLRNGFSIWEAGSLEGIQQLQMDWKCISFPHDVQTSFHATYCELNPRSENQFGHVECAQRRCCQGARFMFLRNSNKRKMGGGDLKSQKLSLCKRIPVPIGKEKAG